MPALPSSSASKRRRSRTFAPTEARGWVMRAASTLATLALVAGGALTAVLVAPATASATPADQIVFSASADDSNVLAGAPVNLNLSASNQTDAPATNLYNLSFSYTLPTGVTYAGPTTPTTAGEPTIITVWDDPEQTTSHQVLVWKNVADLPIGDEYALNFSVQPDAALYPVGSVITGSGGAFANQAPRIIPTFDANGVAVPASYSASGTGDAADVTVSALKVVKREPSPEAELMRGIHENVTTFTVEITNTNVAPTDAVTVIDYLPAGLEFLGCGGPGWSDNSAAAEYPGSGPLPAAPALAAPECATPDSVATVTNPPGGPSGTFTVITWSIPALAAGESRIITYRSGIPLRENTTSWPAGEPDPASGLQGSNLDNNTGASTRQDGETINYTNRVDVEGTYSGPVVPGTSTTVGDSETEAVAASDVSIVKTANTSSFTAGSNAEFTLDLRTSEYTSAGGLIIHDTVPDGLCPLLPAGFTPPAGYPADCSDTGTVTGATLLSVAVGPTPGSWEMTFEVDDIAANGTATVSYDIRMRATFANGTPTSAGDSFVNEAVLDGETTPIPGTGETGQLGVTDDSDAELEANTSDISKKILPRSDVVDVAQCAAATGYLDETAGTPPPTFQLGDRICFELRVNFASSTKTRNGQVTDFVPTGTTLDGWTLGDAATGNTLTPAEVQLTTIDDDHAVWNLGTDDGSGNRYLAQSGVLVLYISTVVTEINPDLTTVDITANLMKYRQENSSGKVTSLRDNASFGIAPAPVVSLDKRVLTSPNVDEGDVVNYQLDVTNITPAENPLHTVENVVIWDALPTGIQCSDISAISDAGTCTDPGDPGHPVFAGSTTTSAITWLIPDEIVVGAPARSVTYSLTIPSPTSVSTVFTNNASVTEFTSPNTNLAIQPNDTHYYPKDSLNTSVSDQWNTPGANDSASVRMPDVVPGKSINGYRNPVSGDSIPEAVAGAWVDFSITATIPRESTVFNAVLSDTLPANLDLVTAEPITVTFPDGTVYELGDTLPTGYTLTAAGKTVTLTFPETLTNLDPASATYALNFTGRVAPTFTALTLGNTANFASTPTLESTDPITRTSTLNFPVDFPQVAPSKSADKANATGGEIVTYTLRLLNPVSPSTSSGFDTIIVDCIPAGLTFVPGSVTSASGITYAANQNEGGACTVAGTTKVVFDVGTVAPGADMTVSYQVTVDNPAIAGRTFANTATVETSSLETGTRDPSIERVDYPGSSTSVNVVVPTSISTKTVTPTNPTIGQNVSYTITETLPPRIGFYNASIIDVLPNQAQISVGAATVSCTTVEAVPVDCMSTLPGAGGTLTASGNTIGWYLGNVTGATVPRVVTVTYTGTVTAVAANVANATRVNSTFLQWNLSDKGRPANAAITGDLKSNTSTATVRIAEPQLTIAKRVNAVAATSVAPGTGFTYAITVTNRAQTSPVQVSAAHNIRVVDVVPVGVIATIPATLPAGVTATRSNPAGSAGGTITWNITGPLAPGANIVLNYTATFVDSASLPSTAQVNTATLDRYTSLADPAAGRTYPTAAKPTASASVTPLLPQVSLAKSVTSGDTAYVGTPFGWTLRLTNANGANTGTAASVTPQDVLPPNWVYNAGSSTVTVNGVPVTGAAKEPTITGTAATGFTLTWGAYGPLPKNAAIVVTFTATPSADALVTPGVVAAHINTLSAQTRDATGATASAAGSYTGANSNASAFIRAADLKITKTGVPSLVAGETATGFTISVTNDGPSPAVGPIVVKDVATALPAGVTITALSSTSSDWVCTLATLECVYSGTLASGATLTDIVVTVAVAESVADGTVIPNTATVAARTHDPNTANNTSTDNTVVGTSADLSLLKSSTQPPAAGGPVSWLLTVTNYGPSTSHGPITVSDQLPTTVLGATASGPAGSVCTVSSSNLLECTLDSIPLGGSRVITVEGTLASSATGTLDNTATVSGSTADPVPGNNSSSITQPIDVQTTLLANKELLTVPLVAGNTADYRITIRNGGLADAAGVTMTDPLPTGMELLSLQSQTGPGTWTCSGTTVASCVLSGTLPAGQESVVVLRVQLLADAPIASVTNVATASATNAPPVDAISVSDVTGVADLSVAKTHTPPSVIAGETVAYTLTATNNGPSNSPVAPAVTVVDTLPTGLSVQDVTFGSDWDCTWAVGLGTVTCDALAPMPAGTTLGTIVVTALVDAAFGPGILTNQATISGSLSDPNLANNIARDPTTITTQADVSIEKSAVSPTATAGEQASFTIAVTGNGPSHADSLSITDSLPAGLSIASVSVDDPAWSCTAVVGATTFGCQAADLGVGQTVTITVVTTVDASTPDGTVLTNTALLGWLDSRGSHSDDSSAPVTIVASADLSLTKTARADSVVAGESVGFDLVLSNAGPSTAVAPIVITDTLPVGFSFDSTDTPDSWTCVFEDPTPAGQLVTCTLAPELSILPGASAPSLGIVAAVSSDAQAGTVTNSAVASSPTDPDGSAIATATVLVELDADLSITKSHDAGSVRIDEALEFTLVVSNTGPSTASAVVISDELPAGLEFVSAVASDDAPVTCAPNAENPQRIDCVLEGTLARDASVTITVTATVLATAYPGVTNAASVSAETPDSDPENNSITDDVVVPPQVSLSLAKTHEGNFVSGSNGTYVFAISNAGPTENPGPLTVTDRLPAGVSFISATSADPAVAEALSCAANGQVVTCDIPEILPVGGTVSFRITVSISAAAGTTLVNEATVTSAAQNLTPELSIDSDSVLVLAPSALPNTGSALLMPVLLALMLVAGGVLALQRRRGFGTI